MVGSRSRSARRTASSSSMSVRVQSSRTSATCTWSAMAKVRSKSEKRSPPSTASDPTAAPATTRSSSSAIRSRRSRRASRCSTVNTKRDPSPRRHSERGPWRCCAGQAYGGPQEGSEPASAPEPREQDRQGDELCADTEADERLPAANAPDQVTEVLAEEPRQPGQRQEDRRDNRQLLHHRVEPIRDGREVDVHRARQQVAVAVDQVADPDQVVVDVAEIALVALRQPGQLRDAAHQPCERVALRADRLAHAHQHALHPEDLLQLPIIGPQEDLVLELVDPVVEGGEYREEAVDQPVDDPVEEQRGTVDRLLALLEAAADLGERGTVVSVNGD